MTTAVAAVETSASTHGRGCMRASPLSGVSVLPNVWARIMAPCSEAQYELMSAHSVAWICRPLGSQGCNRRPRSGRPSSRRLRRTVGRERGHAEPLHRRGERLAARGRDAQLLVQLLPLEPGRLARVAQRTLEERSRGNEDSHLPCGGARRGGESLYEASMDQRGDQSGLKERAPSGP